MLFSYAIEGFLGWLSRFKLIRLRRISLATLPRYGRMGGCVFITAGPITKLCAWGRRIVEDMCYERLRAEACVD